MNLEDLIHNRIVIAVDMDGVLIDFIKTANKITGMNLKEGDLDAMTKADKNKFWGRIVRHVKEGGTFFQDMDTLPDAMDLWRYVQRHPHFILTAAGGRIPHANREKITSAHRHFGSNTRVEVVESAKAKSRFAGPNIVLIDDRAKAIDPWVAAGGIGILHTSAANTIAKLQELGL